MKHRLLVHILLLAIFFLRPGLSFAEDVVSWDGIQWDFERLPGGFVVVGDIHGDLEALRHILAQSGLISSRDRWVGGAKRLVLLGDLIDRGPESRAVMDFVMDLEVSAARSGGAVHTLLGNHELMVTQGDFRYLSSRDRQTFKEFSSLEFDPLSGVRAAFSNDSKYARWIRSRNAMIRIGDDLFVHAGVDAWPSKDPGKINATVRAWLRWYQGVGQRPPSTTEWVIQDEGPLWTRAMALSQPGSVILSTRSFEKILREMGSRRVFSGHTIQEDVVVRHPLYGERVVLADTAISTAYGGQLTAVESAPNGLVVRHFPRPLPGPYRDYPVAPRRSESGWVNKCVGALRRIGVAQ